MPQKLILIFALLFLLSACGGSDKESPSQTNTPQDIENTSTLKDEVILVESDRDNWVSSTSATSWRLRELRNDITNGSVLLLNDVAVRVTGTRIENNISVLEVESAGIEDVFFEIRNC